MALTDFSASCDREAGFEDWTEGGDTDCFCAASVAVPPDVEVAGPEFAASALRWVADRMCWLDDDGRWWTNDRPDVSFSCPAEIDSAASVDAGTW